MSDEQQDVIPTDAEQAEQEQQVENTSSEATAEQEAEQQTEQQTEEAQKKEPWFQKRIGELTREKYEAKRAADDARAEAERLRQAIAQGQQSDQSDVPDVAALAEQRAQALVAERAFNAACNKVFQDGTAEFENFDQSVRNLQMAGQSRDFLDFVAASDAGHKLINHLGADANLDEAARILALPPIQMARELTKLELKLSQPAAKPVSRAPDPIKPIGSGRTTDTGLSDDLPIDEWMRRNQKLRR